MFEFGPLWLVSLHAPTAVFGPYWAALVATLGLGGYLTGKLHLERTRPVLGLAVVLAATPILLAASHLVLAVVVAQAALQLVLTIIGIHAGLLLHDSVPSAIRAGVSSGVGTLSWVLFLPFSLVFGWLARAHGVQWGGWVLVGVVALLALLLAASTRTRQATPAASGNAPELPEDRTDPPTELACRELVSLVTDYLDGVLPASWKTEIDNHLDGCDGCTRYLQQLRATIDALERLDAYSHQPPLVRPPTPAPNA